MAPEQITAVVSARICKHMNADHQDAVLAYAKHYGEVKQANSAKMIEVTPIAMKLAVDGELIQIRFSHKLTDSEDAHRTLVSMLKAIPRTD